MLIIWAGKDGDDGHQDRRHSFAFFFGEGVRPTNQKEKVVSI